MAEMKATVFGANGFVGRALVSYLRGKGYDVREVVRGDATWRGADLGHAFYCIGLTADFRSRPFETIEAHCGFLKEVLSGARFTSFVYLSSTRVYARASSTDEAAAIPVVPGDPDDLYNISKLMGESACLGSGLSNARVARLSNVFGEDLESQNFLTSVLSDATRARPCISGPASRRRRTTCGSGTWCGRWRRSRAKAAIRSRTSPTGATPPMARFMEAVAAATGATVSVVPDAPTVRFPEIATQRLDRLIGSDRVALSGRVGELAAAFARRG